ncbi:MAG: heavy-metal-associated domain-containing protein [Spirochaetes bacterium]|nr:heavy-metal-associated domain-containing protein [Spirochaetota bacterium]
MATDLGPGRGKEAIESSVRGLKGTTSVSADPDTKVVVEFDESGITVDDIRHRIERAGYHADELRDEV